MDKRSTSNSTDFFQPVIATLGLITSIVATLLPIFPLESLQKYFINVNFIQIISFSTFILGAILLWLIIEQSIGYINLPIGRKFWKRHSTDEDDEPQPLFVINNLRLHIGSIIINTLLVCLFLWLSQFKGLYPALAQALVYATFFFILISSFGIMYSFSKMKFSYDENKENFPKTLFDTLEKNGQLQSGLEIIENTELPFQRVSELNIMPFPGMARSVVVKTVEQPSKKLVCLVSTDGKTLYRAIEAEERQ